MNYIVLNLSYKKSLFEVYPILETLIKKTFLVVR